MQYLRGAAEAAIGLFFIGLIFSVVALFFGPGSQRDVEARVKDSLNDPESAMFRDLVLGDEFACGYVNARNRMGGYVGYVRFVADRYDLGDQPLLDFEEDRSLVSDLWEVYCLPDDRSFVKRVHESLKRWF